jgi:capsular polysaccharide export protein
VVPVADHAAEKKDDRLAGIRRLHFYSSFAWSVEQLTAFIGLRPPVISFNPFFAPRDSEAIAGWGTKSRSRYAMEAAARRGLPYIALEEGFLRSVGFGQQYVEPLSLIIDPVGIYYDSTRPSWLENLLAEGPLDDPKLLTRAEAAIDLLRTEKLTKFNTAPTIDEEDLDAQVGEDFVLIVDQTYNDESVLRSGAGPKPFSTMLRQARLDHPDRRIVIKSHTTVLNTAGPGYFTARNDQDDRVVVFDRDINPWQLLERCHAVYTVSSQLGFEALMAGKPVTCFGLPFYAGWGLTRDRVACPRRQRRRSLAQVFAAAYLLYPRYIDPYLGQRCEFERVAEILLHLRARNEMNRVSTSLAGLDPERLPAARRLYRRLGGSLTVVKHGDELTTGPEESRSRVLLSEDIAMEIIGRGDQDRLAAARILVAPIAERLLAPTLAGRPLGFRRAPLAEVSFGRDAWRERLAAMPFGPHDRHRARDLIATLRGLDRHLGNHFSSTAVPDTIAALAVIETEDWRHPETLRALLARLREQGAGGTQGATVMASPRWRELANLAREATPHAGPDPVIVPSEAIPALVARAAEIHVLGSPAGILGLVHGAKVVVHGDPIYAGWGLTEDLGEVPRLGRRLSIEELIAGLVLRDHDYLDPHSGYPGELAWILARPAVGGAPRLTYQTDSRTAVKIDHLLGALLGFTRLWKRPRG